MRLYVKNDILFHKSVAKGFKGEGVAQRKGPEFDSQYHKRKGLEFDSQYHKN